MRIEELILDGFKSYPVRTSISGWDSSFNAITGLNGSGKSNILDAICFVLGITNLTAVRAANLQDLIYKRGQAGVTKASVTIVFNNTDRATSPVGFENYKQVTVTRQVAMGGVSKYLINGHRATQQNVQNLFQSVQLNINNPNFLIMQGKITKVLNMKPPEILGMIEEAAGTSMFEDKKDKAIKTMAKKEKKMDEIQELLREEITPKLDRLREEKRVYLEFQKAASELERLSRLVIAYDWTTAMQRVEKSSETLKEKEIAIKTLAQNTKQMQAEIATMENEVKAIMKRREKEMAKGGKVQTLENKVKELDKDVARVKTKVNLKEGSIVDDENKAAELEGTVVELTAQHAEKKASNEKANAKFATLKADYDTLASALKQSEDLLQTLITGLSSSSSDAESTSVGYMGQLAAARNRLAGLGTETEQAKLQMDHLAKELKEKEPRAKKAETDGKGLFTELEQARKTVSQLDIELQKLDWNEDAENQLRDRRDAANAKVCELLEKKDAVKSKLAGLDFHYSDPSKDFDRSQVKGLVATLISIEPDNFKYSTALEVCAGGRLYNVVVENEKVGSQLLENGKLQKRVTMIPLNQIQAFAASATKVATAQKIAPGAADLALSLIGYEDDVSKAMEYVFGNTLVCPDAKAAKAVTFHKDIRMKSVTLEGDIYDPSGTLSGGSRPGTSGVLVKVQDLKAIEKELSGRKKELDDIEKEWNAAKAKMQRFKDAKKARDLKAHEVTLLEARVKESNATRVIDEVAQIKTSLTEYKTVISDADKKRKEAEAEIKRLEKEMNEFKNNREGKLNELKAEIAKKKANLSKQTSNVKTLQRESQTAELELQQMLADIESAKQEVEEATKATGKSQKELKSLQAELVEIQNERDSVASQLKEETKLLSSFARELEELENAMKSKKTDISNVEVRQKEMTHELDKIKKDQKAAEQAVSKMESQYEWIADDRPNFGKQGTRYDFQAVRMADIKRDCAKLEEQQQGQRKKVNPKVMSMIDSVEKKEKELLKMHSQVLKDKGKIEETIAKLDVYKKDALQKTWEKVNGDFGNIFGELLPGNFAKLQPPEDQDITQGLEVKVRLGQVWKASLTELSGGQRSLIALSLIMSLLQFKPAPMYILDEVDAALDLSHTQHIGHLFRTRFKGSQFIVVSLKEGLFTNAQVLFRTRFRDGTSVVERIAQRSTNPATAALYATGSDASIISNTSRSAPTPGRRAVATAA